MTAVLVAVNVLVFVLWRTAERPRLGWLVANFLVSTEAVAGGRVWTLLLAEFSHVDASHLLFNMIALWTFGRGVERTIGPWRLLHLYVAGALVASLGYLVYAFAVGSPVPALGASGAVSAIAVVFGCLYPRAVLLLNFFIPLPAALAVVLFIVIDTVGLLHPHGSTVAHAAHLGGALYGFLYWLLWIRPRLRLLPDDAAVI